MACRRGPVEVQGRGFVMKVCNIELTDGEIFLDGTKCTSANEAYLLFRSRYNKALGKATHLMLGHIGVRNERYTKVGIDFDERYREELRKEFDGKSRVNYYILGFLDVSYGRMFGQWNLDEGFRDADDEHAERYLDWVMSAGMHNTRQLGRRRHDGKKYIKNEYGNGRSKNSKCSGGEEAA